MKTIDNYLQEGYLLSDNTIVCDPKRFSKTGKILICGIPGSGKTTLGRKLSKKHDAKLYETDDMLQDLLEEYNLNSPSDIELSENEIGDFFLNKLSSLIKDRKRWIIEGIGLADFFKEREKQFRNITFDQTTIFLGDSVLKSLYRSFKRTLKSDKEKGWITKYLKWTKNFPSFQKAVTQYRKSRIEESETVEKLEKSTLIK